MHAVVDAVPKRNELIALCDSLSLFSPRDERT